MEEPHRRARVHLQRTTHLLNSVFQEMSRTPAASEAQSSLELVASTLGNESHAPEALATAIAVAHARAMRAVIEVALPVSGTSRLRESDRAVASMLELCTELLLAEEALANPAPSRPARAVDLTAFPIERCAAIAAGLDFRPAETSRLLEHHGLDRRRWNDLQLHWQTMLDEEMCEGKRQLLARYDNAYVAALEAERGPLDAADYARLQVSASRGTEAAAMSSLGIPLRSLSAIERVWLRRVVSDADARERVRSALEQERDR